MTIHFATRASLRLNAVRSLIDASHEAGQAYVEMAKACERAARELNKAAGDFRRAARQQKKTGVAGATNDTKN
ncbi:hypothetical protein [Luteibacter yeojuensis]|uniref:Uncharacterized protein n=1 Tax=Luteibacter yeojuensis TaxID=345309 RepID=A0A7X5QU97_9GAMM|nr:hypothetical protein [Luteibacter yeojuensis]NID15402.1 hypothetical protein [Luteibacter yeojuensis]